jgi:hypothetical protein
MTKVLAFIVALTLALTSVATVKTAKNQAEQPDMRLSFNLDHDVEM